MDANTPESDEKSVEVKPRRPLNLTGERLGSRVQLAEALLKSGRTITGTAKDLKISRHSVQAIAARMRTGAVKGVAALSGAPQEQVFDAYVKGNLQRVARLALSSITPEKAENSTLRDLSFSVDKTLGRLESIEARQKNVHIFSEILSNYGVVPSHSVSRLTLEQRVTVETAGKKPEAADE